MLRSDSAKNRECPDSIELESRMAAALERTGICSASRFEVGFQREMIVNVLVRTLGVTVGVLVMLAGCAKDPERAKKEALDAGNCAFEQQQFAEASINYRKAVQLDSKYGVAREK